MTTLLAIVRALDITKVGMCPTCMRVSFLTFIGFLILTFGAQVLNLPGKEALFVTTVFFALLWASHVVRRAALSSYDRPGASSSRRRALRFGMTLAGAAAMSVAFPWQARADSACGGWGQGSGCEPCPSNCMRQDSNCGCFQCRSCGANCGDDVC